mmetsp:Transcript_1382/g.1226  ORF Transcript_1382/g.1226 Transcript_1382/m.1226 type:complete len:95 (+) Transcript_1382:305-589(+)
MKRKLALNSLWSTFCDYEMDRVTKVKFQTGDWSQRPLLYDMIAYAATDSRCLIYLRYLLLIMTLNGPSFEHKEEIPFLNGSLTIKQLNKLYVKM